MKKLKVNLFGESYRIHLLELNPTLFNKLQDAAKKLNEPLDEAVFNLFFFNKLNIIGIQSLNDLNKKSFCGLINNSKSQIEILYGRKRIAKFALNDLFIPTTLFPIYNTRVYNESHINLPEGLYIEEIEIGLMGSYEVEVDQFKIEKLKFHLVMLEGLNSSYELLHKISYKGRFLTSNKSDTLIRRQTGFLKN